MSTSAVAAPTKAAILHLYASMLRTSRSFSSYNFRHYFVGKTQDTFRAMQVERDQAKLKMMYNEAVKDLSVLRRSAIVNQLYGGWKLAVEVKEKGEHEKQREPQGWD